MAGNQASYKPYPASAGGVLRMGDASTLDCRCARRRDANGAGARHKVLPFPSWYAQNPWHHRRLYLTDAMSARRGIYVAPFDELADPRVLAELATRAEARGWNGFFLWDHIAYRPPVRAVADPWVA